MTNKDIHVLVRNEFDSFLKEHGLKRTNSNTWIMVRNELIHTVILHFSYGQEDFNFDIAVQPLCIPADRINVNISQRLNYFDSRSEYHSWGNCDEQQLQNDIDDAKSVFIKDVFTWFDKILDCRALLKFLNTTEAGKAFHLSPQCRLELKAELCYYEHRFFRARIYEKKLHDISSDSNDTIDRLSKLSQLADEGNERLDSYFKAVIDNNWKILKL